MAQIIRVDFSKQGRELREMTGKLHAEKKEPLTMNQKVFYCLFVQNPDLQIFRNVV